MTLRRRRATLAILFGATLALGLSAAFAAEEKFSVWWSPALEVESLDKVQERLDAIIDGWRGTIVTRRRDGTEETALMDTCAKAIQLTEAGYEVSFQYGYQLVLLARCRAIEALLDIRPAERSYLHDFVLDESSVRFLPVMLDMMAPCISYRGRVLLNAEREPLARVQEIVEIEILPNGRLSILASSTSTEMEVWSRGDMTGDGLEDIAVRALVSARGGSWSAQGLFLLSRDGPDEVLYVVDRDVENHRC